MFAQAILIGGNIYQREHSRGAGAEASGPNDRFCQYSPCLRPLGRLTLCDRCVDPGG